MKCNKCDEFLVHLTKSNVARLADQKRYHGRFAFWLSPHWANLHKKLGLRLFPGMPLAFSRQNLHTDSLRALLAKGLFTHHEQQRFEPLVTKNLNHFPIVTLLKWMCSRDIYMLY